MMIDRESRTQLAEFIRHLVVGQITNDEFEDRLLLHSADPAVWEVFSSGAWCLYSDLWEYRLTGKYRLLKEARREVARWILFLKTNLEYEWPRLGRFRSLLLLFGNLFSVGLIGVTYRKYFRRFGDWDVWPFLRRSDYDLALKQPPYFTGASNSTLEPIGEQLAAMGGTVRFETEVVNQLTVPPTRLRLS